MAKRVIHEPSHTLGEYLLRPGLTRIGLTPDQVSLRTPLGRFCSGEESRFYLNIPFTSAMMQAVTDARLAIALALQGGLGFIFPSQQIANQAAMVEEGKEFKSGYVRSKANLAPDAPLAEAIKLIDEKGYSTIPITERGSPNGRLYGILTTSDFWRHKDPEGRPVREFMTPIEALVLGNEGITLGEANETMRQRKRKSLPVIDVNRNLVSLVFKRDYEEHKAHPNQLVSPADKRLLIGAGLNTHDYEQRAPALLEAGADALCFDSSDGHSEYQARAIRHVLGLIGEHERATGKRVILGGGNIITQDAFFYLAATGLDFLKIGIGGGSICITRERKGIGVGQATAIEEVCAARDELFARDGIYLPLISDGSIVYDYQITAALTLGADAVMLGRYFARTEEAPGPKRFVNGQMMKGYWGEGSARARNWQRYGDAGVKALLLEEGVDGYVPYAGLLSYCLNETLHTIRSTMAGNLGVDSIPALHRDAVPGLVSHQTLVEGGAHDILVPAEISNYKHQQWGMRAA